MMKIREHRALRGPNYFSRYPTITMLLDIGELEDMPSDKAEGFTKALLDHLPTLREHRCSPGYPGGFVERLERGTWAGHIVEHVALELQCLAGMTVGFGKTRETNERGVYRVVYRYRNEAAGLQAGRDAVEIVSAIFAGNKVDVDGVIERLKEIRQEHAFGPSTGSIVHEAESEASRGSASTKAAMCSWATACTSERSAPR
jgi:cyanophycin synthetase